jgi:uncharacterized protein YndB with AHSA1/START domain
MDEATETPAVAHDTFALERSFAAPPARVFAAWATPDGKAAWFGAPADQWKALRRDFDFRVGGSEVVEGKWVSGTVTRFDAFYLDIVPDRRIVYAYSMHQDDRHISISLATVELFPNGTGTRLVVTEQGAFLDGYQDGGCSSQSSAV